MHHRTERAAWISRDASANLTEEPCRVRRVATAPSKRFFDSCTLKRNDLNYVAQLATTAKPRRCARWVPQKPTTDGYTAMQLAAFLGENRVNLVPDVAVSGDGSSGLANVMIV